ADEDRLTYEEAALRAASVRWASEAPSLPLASGAFTVELAQGALGQTCFRLTLRTLQHVPPFEHCTYAVVWSSSIRIAFYETVVALVTQPLLGWNELLVLRPRPAESPAWIADTITSATIDPELGYVELAGFSPDGAHLAVVRESCATGPLGSPNTLAP